MTYAERCNLAHDLRVLSQETITMKTNHLLFLLSIFLITTVGHASSSNTDMIVLPTYVITAPRNSPPELAIKASLDTYRQQNQKQALKILRPNQLAPMSTSPLHLAATTADQISGNGGRGKS